MEQNNQAAVIAVVEYENVYSTRHLRIGDEVVMNMDKEARGWGRKGAPDGTKGTVIGFYVYYTTRHLNMGEKPGIYRGNGAVMVEWETGEVDSHGSDIAIPKHLLEQRRLDTAWNNAFDKSVRQFDLPKFKYMVGNKVQSFRKFNGKIEHDTAVITNIDFEDIVDLRTGDLLPAEQWENNRIFHIELEGGGSTRSSIKEIGDIIDEGNYWAWENDKSQLKFTDLQDECMFYASIGKRKQVRSPRSGDYEWTIQDAIEAVERGDIDLIGKSGSFFGSKNFTVVYKLDDDLAELAIRTRAETINGFKDFKREPQPAKKYFVSFAVPGTNITLTATKQIEAYIPPVLGEYLVIEGKQYKVNHSFNLRTEEDLDKPINLTPVFLLQQTTEIKLGSGVDSVVDIPDNLRADLAYGVFSDLSKKGWDVGSFENT